MRLWTTQTLISDPPTRQLCHCGTLLGLFSALTGPLMSHGLVGLSPVGVVGVVGDVGDVCGLQSHHSLPPRTATARLSAGQTGRPDS